MQKWIIRPMDVFDLNAVYAIEQNVHITPWSKEILYHCMLVGYQCYVLCIKKRSKERLIGYRIQRISDNALHILNLCIDRPYQRKGYGKILLDHCIKNISIENQISEIKLEVRVNNHKAIKLYEKAGFQIASTLSDYYKDETGMEDALLLIKKLS